MDDEYERCSICGKDKICKEPAVKEPAVKEPAVKDRTKGMILDKNPNVMVIFFIEICIS